jgi:Uma2 family endonuclease
MAIQERIGMPLADFIRWSSEAPFELIDGQVVPRMPTVSGHNKASKRIFMLLVPFEAEGLGEVFQEATYVLTDAPDWVRGSRIPDVMFVSAAKLKQFEESIPDADSKPYILVPDIAVEVVSPTDSYSDIDARVSRYLQDGVLLIWIIDPQRQKVAVHQLGSDQQANLEGDAILDGGAVLPGFKVAVKEIFA